MKIFPPVFPKVPHYRASADLVHEVRRVVCLEKIDGANTRIGVPPGAKSPEDIVIGGREVLEGDPGFSQGILIELIRRDLSLCRRLLAVSAELGQDLALYGETCGGKIQAQGFIYGAKILLLLFAAKVGGTWLSYSRPLPPPLLGEDDKEGESAPAARPLPSLIKLAAALSLATPPCLYEGPPEKDRFDALLARPSRHSLDQGFRREDVDNTQEGIVIFSDPLLLDPYGQPLIAKYKHPKRREALEAPPGREGEGPAEFAPSARRAAAASRPVRVQPNSRIIREWSGSAGS